MLPKIKHYVFLGLRYWLLFFTVVVFLLFSESLLYLYPHTEAGFGSFLSMLKYQSRNDANSLRLMFFVGFPFLYLIRHLFLRTLPRSWYYSTGIFLGMLLLYYLFSKARLVILLRIELFGFIGYVLPVILYFKFLDKWLIRLEIRRKRVILQGKV